MKYNPYGWKIISKENKCDEFYQDLTKVDPTDCVLNELGRVCSILFFKNQEYNDLDKEIRDLKKKIHELNEEILELEEKKFNLINKLYE